MPRTAALLLLQTASKCCSGALLHSAATVLPAAAATASWAVAGFASLSIGALPNGRQGWVQGPPGVKAPLLTLLHLLLLVLLLLAVAGGASCCLWLGRQLQLVLECMQLLQLADRARNHGCERALPAGSPCRWPCLRGSRGLRGAAAAADWLSGGQTGGASGAGAGRQCALQLSLLALLLDLLLGVLLGEPAC